MAVASSTRRSWAALLEDGPNEGNSIAVDSAGQAYVTGFTNSPNFPLKNPFQATNADLSAAYVTKLNSSGSALVYSTYLGGSSLDVGESIAVDRYGKAYVTGFTILAGLSDDEQRRPARLSRPGSMPS